MSADDFDFAEEPLARGRAPWKGEEGLEYVIREWTEDGYVARNLVLDAKLPSKEGRSEPFPAALHAGVRQALEAKGIKNLYSHQHEAFERASRGEHLVVATPTASGKSLCFNLPVLDALARDEGARALFLFPTKALSRDQEHALHKLLREAGLSHGAITFDGDTPGDARRAARERSGVILTNPDMLHTGMLPHHTSWARLFSNLKYVVIDEVHAYRGVFGSHLANVIRRLRRIAAFHGSKPTFLFASATIGNPREHASRMLGDEVALVGDSGAPEGPRRVMVYNPPIVNAELGIRASYVKSAVKLARDLVRAKVPTIVFGPSRNSVEVMLKYLRDVLVREKIDPNVIHAYRGGYLPEQRRRVEEGLRSGAIRCVVATNALELGIDIGSLDAVVCAGYPGTVAALWQRFGRAGRRKDGSLAVLVTSSSPIDQFVARDAKTLLSAAIEHARIDPDNVEVLIQHLKCAAFELPFLAGDRFGDVPVESVSEALEYLARHEVLHVSEKGGVKSFHWATDAYPANHVSLRNIGWDNFVIVDLRDNKDFAEMDWRSVHTMLHEQAIYQHDGEQYQVERLDYENHKAFVRKVDPDYYTDAMTYTRVAVLSEQDAAVVDLGGAACAPAGVGEVNVVEKVVGFKKIKFHSHENVGYGEVHLPEMEMQTTAFWLTCPEETVTSFDAPRSEVVDAFRGIGHAMHVVAAMALMVDPRDLGYEVGSRHGDDGMPETGAGAGYDPTLFLFDRYAGGIGLSSRLFEDREGLMRRTRRLIDACPCEEGCPACIGPAIANDLEGVQKPSRTRKRIALELFSIFGVGEVH